MPDRAATGSSSPESPIGTSQAEPSGARRRSRFKHLGVSTEGVPFGRSAHRCSSYCGVFRCFREASHRGKHCGGTGNTTNPFVWPVEP